ncbi:MAG: formylglycine-generating enzyme family protein [Sandarakinorhabdus sp.]|nr:formylglycine-generating enzyme family protein [Sandarakinorhabdus sp.]
MSDSAQSTGADSANPAVIDARFTKMAHIPGGRFRMGADDGYPEEAPAHSVEIDGFWIDRHAVTNAEFAAFVAATGHITIAERVPRTEDYPGALPEMLFAGSLVFKRTQRTVDIGDWSRWWELRAGADWRHPYGPQSTIKGLADHPVVHVAYADAHAYALWADKDLPTEAEHEYAARGGLDGATYAWGNVFRPGGKHMANTWQGKFPHQNLLEDGWEATAPVGSFPANGYGLFDMIGNTWEWTQDWFQPGHNADPAKACCMPKNPRGPAIATNDPAAPIPQRVLKGGSFLCAPSYCQRYRPAARHAESIDTSTCHIGFRCVVRS